jgi:hypothetical protein
MAAEPIPLRATELEVLSWADIIAEPDAPPATIRAGVPQVGVTVVAGSPKVGKTLWTMQIALESGRPTLIVLEEGDRHGISFRLRHQAAALGIEEPPIVLAHRQRLRLDEPKSVDRIRGYIEAEKIDLVILDPLNRLHSADENRPSEMTKVMDGMARIAYDHECAVLAVHHLGKPSKERRGDIWDRFRGASSIRSGTDANLVMDGTGDRIHLVGEFRDAEPLSEWLELDRETLTFQPSDAPVIPAKVDPIALRTFVEERGQVTAAQIVTEFHVSKPTAFVALRALGCDEWAGIRNVLTFSLGTGK